MNARAKSSSGVLSSVLLAAQFVVAAVAIAAVYFRRVEIPHCDLACDFQMLEVTSTAFTALAVGTFIIVAIVQLVIPGPPRWWLPGIGIVVTVIGSLIANRMSDIALLMT